MNERFIKIFSNLAFYEDFIGRKFPAKAYQKAVQIFKDLNFEIDNANQIKGIPGIGDGILKKVDSYLTSGTFSKYEEFLKSPAKDCMDIASIKGFGVNKAKRLFDAGFKTLESLKEKTKTLAIGQPLIDGMNFTKAMKIGLDYEAHTNKNRMTVEEHDEVANPLLEELNKCTDVEISEAAGSRRRYDGSSDYTIGDIDIIIKLTNSNSEKEIVEKTKNVRNICECLLDEVAMSGNTKISGIKNSRQVDFRIVSRGYEALRLHATGPMNWNIKCRKIAISKGWILNEYGLFETSSGLLVSEKEKEILDKLEIGWVEPKNRKDF